MLGVNVEQVNAKLGHAAGGSQRWSFQLLVLRLGLLQDGDVGVGVFSDCGRSTGRQDMTHAFTAVAQFSGPDLENVGRSEARRRSGLLTTPEELVRHSLC